MQLLAAEVTFPPELRTRAGGSGGDLPVRPTGLRGPLALDPPRRLLERVEKLLVRPHSGESSVPGQLHPAQGGGAGVWRPRLRDGAARRRSPGTPSGRKAVARPVRGGPGTHGEDVRWRTHERPSSRVRRQRDRPGRLLQRRPPRHLRRDRVRARRAPGSASPPQRPLPEPRELEVQERRARGGGGRRGLGQGVCAGDFDGDGRLDLYVTNFGPNFLFRGNGDGTFTDVAAAAGGQAAADMGCAFFDGNGTVALDLYVARYGRDLGRRGQGRAHPRRRGGPKTMVGPVGLPERPTSTS